MLPTSSLGSFSTYINPSATILHFGFFLFLVKELFPFCVHVLVRPILILVFLNPLFCLFVYHLTSAVSCFPLSTCSACSSRLSEVQGCSWPQEQRTTEFAKCLRRSTLRGVVVGPLTPILPQIGFFLLSSKNRTCDHGIELAAGEILQNPFFYLRTQKKTTKIGSNLKSPKC